MKISKGTKLLIMGLVLVVIDQVIKILVKTNMSIGEHFNVIGNWFQIYFIENEGMAFGMKFGGQTGKLLLSIFRIVLFGALVYWIRSLLKKDTPAGVLVGLALITTGALGNIIDCMFYGILFGESTYTSVAQFLPEGGGYAPFFFGKVVDMFYFPIIDTTFPEWMPLIGGNPFRFFAPVFNFADSCVTCGALYLIFFQWRFFAREEKK
ncbi:MAG: lipoprotein signal peptidase [Bacteroidetes bacterium]|uniref:Lipoprotein signal peptidase n=1 Tax=Candidatus Cryptobacteroides merdigallinarum TaxID=2840770 RepID=A0A9D9HG75_9BACT|nr:lipoprotein signal peptidase [Candidatus Cryptobacteroides merdigallinarum]